MLFTNEAFLAMTEAERRELAIQSLGWSEPAEFESVLKFGEKFVEDSIQSRIETLDALAELDKLHRLQAEIEAIKAKRQAIRQGS